MTTCTRRLQFCAGHRVQGHENKCAHLHGHNYVVLITAAPHLDSRLDDLGRVIDFSVLKDRVGAWIEMHWDHGFILHEQDTLAIELVRKFVPRVGVRQKLALLNCNPTAENIAGHLLYSVCPAVLASTGVRVTKVEIWETENCKAEASL